jgi:oligopeptide transport system substrate-binding protein
MRRAVLVPPLRELVAPFPPAAPPRLDRARVAFARLGRALAPPRRRRWRAARPLAQAVQAIWRKELGIEVEIENKEWTAYLAAMQELDYDLAGSGWIGDFLDPLTFLEMWSEGNGNNLTGWAHPRFEELLQKSHQEADPARRYAILSEAETIFTEEVPVILVAWYARNYLLHPSVENWHPLLLDNHPYDVLRLRAK